MCASYNFKIGVTFCGEYREKYIRPMCEVLATYPGFSKEVIFYDEWHEHIINGVNADNILRNIYHDQCERVVVLLSPNYSQKIWTGNIEWPAVRALITEGMERNICLLRVDNADISGIPGLYDYETIVKDIDGLDANAIADFVYKNWEYHHKIISKTEAVLPTTDIFDINRFPSCSDDDIAEVIEKGNDATRRAWCFELIKNNRGKDIIENCIGKMDNNAEKCKLLKLIIKENADPQNIYIPKVFSSISNNKYIMDSLIEIHEYNMDLFNSLYVDGNCFTNNLYSKRMKEWLAKS